MPAPLLHLTRLMLRDFRSWPALTVPFQARIVAISGENGAGKTNLLEAISLLGPGRGLRGARAAELSRRQGEALLPWAAAGRFESPWGSFDLGTGTPESGRPERRSFRLDGAPLRTQAELAERVAAVWLTPQMDRLFQDGAGDRRRFLDRLVWALEPHHAREVASYENAMAQRNRLLVQARREGRGADSSWLAGLEDAMARHGVALSAARRGLVARLNATLKGGVTGGFPAARLGLACPVAAALDGAPALAVEDGLRADWAANRGRDAAAGATLSGPHRADLLMTHVPKEIPAALCSTGEQKALLVAVVLAHAALIEAHRGFAPLLLLDEVAAHLDERRRETLFAALAALPAQSFLTGTDPAVFRPLRGLAEGFRAAGGELVPDTDLPVPEAR
ncbi:DNA replication/repair protein RecF [Siccirubricoccus sp. KC 17139]|uniref:DNA replication and repair protein RecF n=1 Tax=Siccirubricoccus soli TaxID=2899147 RepID=A0ABT1D2P6_9PROT|nr:DNA replication/repair protein RecF [Siccirubricoccus soli]MCO6415877.1 DNA replication/repair protein RecF [Siccirubricoccus soli]MCP2682009.1 DNA replication/repair protein RecF [Siccirubricoccus soli]